MRKPILRRRIYFQSDLDTLIRQLQNAQAQLEQEARVFAATPGDSYVAREDLRKAAREFARATNAFLHVRSALRKQLAQRSKSPT